MSIDPLNPRRRGASAKGNHHKSRRGSLAHRRLRVEPLENRWMLDATHLVITVQPPSSVTAGDTFDVQVVAEDDTDNVDTSFTGSVTIALSNNPGSDTLGGTTTLNAVNGAVDFSDLGLTKAAFGYTLQISATGLTSTESHSLTVVAAAATHLVVTSQPPSSVTAGANFGFQVAAEDEFGNVDTSFSGTAIAEIAVNPTGDTLGGSTTVAFLSGLADFIDLNLSKAAPGYELEASALGLGGITTDSLEVTHAAATQFVVTTQPPSTVTAGSNFGVTVTAEDEFGNVDPTFTGAVSIALLDNPGGDMLGGTTTVNAVDGVAEFTDLNLTIADTDYSLSASATGLSMASTASFSVEAAAATHLVISSEPPSIVTSSDPFAMTVRAEDEFGNLATAYGGNATVAIGTNPAGGTLSGTKTVPLSNGVANFTHLILDKAGVGYTLSVSGGTLTGATSSAIEVTHAAATHLVITVQPPSTVTAGDTFSLSVSAEDDADNVDTDFTDSIQLSLVSNPTSDTLGGTLTLNAVDGVATFNDLQLHLAASGYAIRAADSGLASTISNAIAVGAADATHMVITLQPPGEMVANSPFGLTVAAEDEFGNIDTAFNGLATAQIGSNPGGATLAGTTTLSFVDGVATFSGLSINHAGVGYDLEITNADLPTNTTDSFDVTAHGAATGLAFTVEPSPTVTAGTAFSVTVAVRDEFGNVVSDYNGNVTIALDNNPTGATLNGTLTVTAVNGVAQFTDLSINKAAGGYTLSASADALPTTASDEFAIEAASATQMLVTTQPSLSNTAGATFTVVITAEDEFGNVDTNFNSAVNIALLNNPTGATLGGTTSVAAVNGVATFGDLFVGKVGTTYTLEATSTGLPAVPTNEFAVTAGAATQLQFTVEPPASVVQNQTFGLQVTATDDFGNVDTTFDGAIALSFASNPGAGTLLGATTVNAVNGVAVFSGLSIDSAGNAYQLAASAGELPQGTSDEFNVTAHGAATHLVITAQPPSSTDAGGTFALQISAEDEFGNIDTDFTGGVAIALAANPTGAALFGTTTVNAVNGQASFSDLSMTRAGSGYTLQATFTELTSATTDAFSIVAEPAVKLAITAAPPANVTAGASFGLQVAAEDEFGNIDTTFNGAVTIALGANPGSDTLGGTLTVNAVNGVAVFSGLSLSKAAEGYTIVASFTGLTSATTEAFNVVAAAASTLTVTTQPPSSVTAGANFTVQVTVKDEFGNVATSFSGPLTISIANNPSSGTLGGTLTVNAVNGVAEFTGLTLNKAGAGYTLQAAGTSLTSVVTSPVTVNAASATSLIVTTQPPASATAGAAFDVKVSAVDQFGNVDTSFTGSVTIAIGTNPGSGTLSGTKTVNAVAGVADFSNLSLDKSGTGYTLVATLTGLSTTVTTNTFNVVAATASKLIVTAQPPATATAGAAFDVKIAAADQFGNVVTSFTGAVTIALSANPGGGTLGGTLTVNAVNGVADFSNLTLNVATSGYVLQGTFSGLTSVTTNTFAVRAAAATQLVVATAPPSSVAANASFTVGVLALDQFGNVDLTYTGTVTVSIAANPGGSSLGGTTSVVASGGSAVFTNLVLDKAGTGYTLSFASGSLSSATTTPFNVTSTTGTASISGFVYADIIANLALDSGEPLLTGVTIMLTGTDSSGATITPRTTTTASDGSFTFAGLVAGTYTLTKVQPAHLVEAPASPGSLGGTTSGNDVIGGIAVTAGAAGTGYVFRVGGLDPALMTLNMFLNTTASAQEILNSYINGTPATGATSVSVVTQPPASVTAGSTFDVKLAAVDSSGNVVTSYNGVMTIALGNNPGGGSLGGTLSVNAVNGIADFSNLSLTKAGSGYTLVGSAAGLATATTTAFSITAATVSKLALQTQPPSNAVLNAAFDVKVAATDQFGNVVTGFSGNATIGLGANPGSATLGGTTTVAFSNGVADFSTLTLNAIGTGYTLTATSSSLTSVTSNAFNVVASGAATKLVFTTSPPASVTSGGAFSVSVTAEDSAGNVDTSYNGEVELSLGNNPGGGTLGGSLLGHAANGVATFTNLTLDKVGGGYTLKATVSGLTTGVSTAFNVTAAAATKLMVVAQPPSTVVQNQIFDVQIAATDSAGNVDTTFTGTVAMALGNNPGESTLGGTTNVNFVNGVADFATLTIDNLGTGYTLTASNGTLGNVTTGAFNVETHAAASQLVVTSQPPSSVAAGATFSVQITAEDQFGNVDIGFNGNVTIALSVNPGAATLGGTLTVAAVNGVANFSGLSINKTGTGYRLQATVANLVSATTSQMTVTPTAATQMVITTEPPASISADDTFDLVVSAKDALGNVDTSYTGAVTISLLNNPTDTTLGGTLTVNAVAGVATFTGLSVTKVGTGYTIAVEAAGLPSVTSTAFDVTPAAAEDMEFFTLPASPTAVNEPFDVKVAALDEFENIDTAFTGTVTIAIDSNPGTGTLSGTLTVNFVNGIADFPNLVINEVGTGYTLIATNATLGSTTTGGFDVADHTAASQLTVSTQPVESSTAGSTFIVQITAKDEFGNVDSDYNGAITVALGANPGGDTLSGTLTVHAVGGVANFTDLSLIKAAEGYTISATATGLTSATTDAFNITAEAASHIEISVQPPASVVGGDAFTTTVRALDQHGNLDTSFTSSVSVAIEANPGSGTLGGTTTVNFVAGVATFDDLTINNTGSGYTLSYTSSGLEGIESDPFNVTANDTPIEEESAAGEEPLLLASVEFDSAVLPVNSAVLPVADESAEPAGAAYDLLPATEAAAEPQLVAAEAPLPPAGVTAANVELHMAVDTTGVIVAAPQIAAVTTPADASGAAATEDAESVSAMFAKPAKAAAAPAQDAVASREAQWQNAIDAAIAAEDVWISSRGAI